MDKIIKMSFYILGGVIAIIIFFFAGRWSVPTPPNQTGKVKKLKMRNASLKRGMREKEAAFAASIRRYKKALAKARAKKCPPPTTCPDCPKDLSGELKTCQKEKEGVEDLLLTTLEGLGAKTGVKCLFFALGDEFPETPKGYYYKPAGIFKGVSSTVICWWKRHGGSDASASAADSSASTSTPSSSRLGKLEGKVERLDHRVSIVERTAANNSREISKVDKKLEKEKAKVRKTLLLLQKIALKNGG